MTSLTALASVAACGGSLHRLLEMICHFRVQYLAASAACLGLHLLVRDWRWSVVAIGCAGLNAALVLPWYFGKPEVRGELPSARVLLANVFTDNTQSGRLLELVEKEGADLLILQEVNDRWMRELEPLRAAFPFSTAVPREDNFGLAVFSRTPLAGVRTETYGPSEVPSFVFDTAIGATTVRFLATHPLPPGSAESFWERNFQLESMAPLARQSPHPFVLIGDLNLTMWSPNYRRFIRDSGLRDARQGFGIQPSWPAFSQVLRIPLDHCLVSETVHVKDLRIGPDIGSDHFPLFVNLAVDAREREAR